MPNRLCTALLAACSFAVLASAGAVSAEDMVVIVNDSNPATALTVQEVKHYFLKKTGAWKNGEKVRPVDREGQSRERSAFLAKVLGLSSDELTRYWLERQYASAEHPPATVADEASTVKFVAFFKGGIGFVSRSALARAEGVKPVLTLAF
jgi:hypothetical protein